MDCRTDIDASAHSSLRISTENHNHPYALSIASSASSSTSSVFSFDAPSSQSSVSSTSTSWESEQDNAYLLNHAVSRQPVSHASLQEVTTTSYQPKPRHIPNLPPSAVASESRQHPPIKHDKKDSTHHLHHKPSRSPHLHHPNLNTTKRSRRS